MKRFLSVRALVLVMALPSVLCAQQRLEIDHSSGREVVNDWMHGFREFAAVDRDRGLVYVVDASDPLAVKAFAIADGTLVGTFGGGEGEGPGELQAMVAASVAADGVLVSDYQRVNHWSSDGDLVAVWSPHVPGVVDVCALGDHMVVPLPDGALVRTPQGREIVLGEGRTGRALMWDSRSPIEQQATDFMRTQAVCMSDWVYILSGDRLVGYSLSGARKEVALPRELLEAGKRRRGRPYTLLSNGAGSVVVAMWASSLAAAVIDPETGCYSILVDPRPGTSHRLAAIYKDSALVLESPPTTTMIDGKPTRVVHAGESSIISLRPLVPTGGVPCGSATSQELSRDRDHAQTEDDGPARRRTSGPATRTGANENTAKLEEK